MQEFQLLLINEKRGLYYRFSLYFIIGLSVLFIYFAFFEDNDLLDSRKFTLSGFIVLFLIACLFDKRKAPRIYAGSLFFIAYAWSALKFYWLAVGVLLFGLLFILAVRKKVVVLDTEKIIYPSFPKKIIRWTELNNVLIKDGLLTIDFKNNKLIQQLIDESASSVNEKEFNEFCQRQLSVEREKTQGTGNNE